jgi:hypothetical protein
MNDDLTDDRIRHAFLARAAGSPSPELGARIHAAAASSRQERSLIDIPGLGPLRNGRLLAVAALIAVTSVIVAGALLIGAGARPTVSPVVGPTVVPSVAPTAAPATVIPSAAPTAAPATVIPSAAPAAAPATVRPTTGPSTVPSASAGVAAGSVVTVATAKAIDLYATARTTDGPRLPDWRDKIGTIEPGTMLYIAAGPTPISGEEGDEDWFLVQPFDQNAPERAYSLGWVKTPPGDSSILKASGVSCVAGDLSPANLLDLMPVGALACFEGSDITVVGRVACTANSSRPTALQHRASGPAWLDNGQFCAFRTAEGEPYFEIFEFSAVDLPGDWTRRNLAVTGHLDDPKWSECLGREGPPFVTDAQAEFECRLGFHATHAEPAAARQ